MFQVFNRCLGDPTRGDQNPPFVQAVHRRSPAQIHNHFFSVVSFPSLQSSNTLECKTLVEPHGPQNLPDPTTTSSQQVFQPLLRYSAMSWEFLDLLRSFASSIWSSLGTVGSSFLVATGIKSISWWRKVVVMFFGVWNGLPGSLWNCQSRVRHWWFALSCPDKGDCLLWGSFKGTAGVTIRETHITVMTHWEINLSLTAQLTQCNRHPSSSAIIALLDGCL